MKLYHPWHRGGGVGAQRLLEARKAAVILPPAGFSFKDCWKPCPSELSAMGGWLLELCASSLRVAVVLFVE